MDKEKTGSLRDNPHNFLWQAVCFADHDGRIRCFDGRETSLQGDREDRVVSQLVQSVVVISELLDQHLPAGRIQKVLAEHGEKRKKYIHSNLKTGQYGNFCLRIHIDEKKCNWCNMYSMQINMSALVIRFLLLTFKKFLKYVAITLYGEMCVSDGKASMPITCRTSSSCPPSAWLKCFLACLSEERNNPRVKYPWVATNHV